MSNISEQHIEDSEEQLEKIIKQIQDVNELLKNPENQEFFILYKDELKELENKKEILEQAIKQNKATKAKINSVIVEIRSGTGGDEAALFANDIFKMYTRYAETQKWETKILDSKRTETDGLKEIFFELNPSFEAKQNKNADIFSKMKYEGGVHRVQRIPKTEKMGRIHTSTASVAILQKPKKQDSTINPKDLKIDIYKSSGPGGQNVNKRETAVRITHIPTGLIVASQTQRNQLKNKESALAILEARLLEKKQKEKQADIEGKRKAQVGWAKRSEKMRTYNFPQNRLTDHRVKKSWHNLEEIMDGKMDKVIKTLMNYTD
ncbi:MAG: PCRF domain-containing protein [Patescibacteria group bacterium]|nr:PCRF domain-containing protein [Patescibacteria group bacterium]